MHALEHPLLDGLDQRGPVMRVDNGLADLESHMFEPLSATSRITRRAPPESGRGSEYSDACKRLSAAGIDRQRRDRTAPQPLRARSLRCRRSSTHRCGSRRRAPDVRADAARPGPRSRSRREARSRPSRAASRVGLAVVGVALLADRAVRAGQHAQTADEVPAIDGAVRHRRRHRSCGRGHQPAAERRVLHGRRDAELQLVDRQHRHQRRHPDSAITPAAATGVAVRDRGRRAAARPPSRRRPSQRLGIGSASGTRRRQRLGVGVGLERRPRPRSVRPRPPSSPAALGAAPRRVDRGQPPSLAIAPGERSRSASAGADAILLTGLTKPLFPAHVGAGHVHLRQRRHRSRCACRCSSPPHAGQRRRSPCRRRARPAAAADRESVGRAGASVRRVTRPRTARTRRPSAAPSAARRRCAGSAAARSARRGARSPRSAPRPVAPWPPARSPAPPGRSANSTPTIARARPTGVAELDRVLGGGLVPGLGRAAGRRARRRQVHPAARGRPPLRRPRAAAAR